MSTPSLPPVEPSEASRPPRRRRPGQSLVELAVAIPFLLLLLLGTVDLGRLFFDYIELRNAVREGAAYGARNPTDSSGVRNRIWSHGNFVDDASISGPTVSSGCLTPGGSGQISVTASKTFVPVSTSFLADFGLGAVNLSATATMRCLT